MSDHQTSSKYIIDAEDYSQEKNTIDFIHEIAPFLLEDSQDAFQVRGWFKGQTKPTKDNRLNQFTWLRVIRDLALEAFKEDDIYFSYMDHNKRKQWGRLTASERKKQINNLTSQVDKLTKALTETGIPYMPSASRLFNSEVLEEMYKNIDRWDRIKPLDSRPNVEGVEIRETAKILYFRLVRGLSLENQPYKVISLMINLKFSDRQKDNPVTESEVKNWVRSYKIELPETDIY